VQRPEPAEPGEKRWPGVLYVLLQPFVEPHPNSTSDPWRPR
jgi:hypothetical protein